MMDTSRFLRRLLCAAILVQTLFPATVAFGKEFSDLDPNYRNRTVDAEGLVWRDALAGPIALEGAPFGSSEGRRTRFPLEFCGRMECAANYRAMAVQGAGLSIRFQAKAKRISIRATYDEFYVNMKMPAAASGFDVYRNGLFDMVAQPKLDLGDGGVFTFTLRGCSNWTDYQVYFPLQCGIVKLEIGLDATGEVRVPTPHKNGPRPIVLYGSSIANCGNVSRPGLEQSNRIGRLIDIPTVNMGFSGSARGEAAAAEAAAAADPAALVVEYEANAPTLEHFQRSLPAFFKRFRELKPTTPVILSGNPICSYWGGKGRMTILQTWRDAVEAGDRHVEFVDWRSYLEDGDRGDYSMDGEHQNDAGARVMSDVIARRLMTMMEIQR